jgi:hypothetical protein
LGNTIVCTEPSPDVAKALATAAELSAQGGNGPASGSLAASGASAEAVAELAGRSTALLGLRDGLYRACEAYANGVIGQDAYALVLSRYGQLMTTLFLGQDITGAAGVASNAAVTSIALQALGNQSSNSSPGPTTTTTTGPSPKKTSADSPSGGTPKIMLAASGGTTPGMTDGAEPRALPAADSAASGQNAENHASGLGGDDAGHARRPPRALLKAFLHVESEIFASGQQHRDQAD